MKSISGFCRLLHTQGMDVSGRVRYHFIIFPVHWNVKNIKTFFLNKKKKKGFAGMVSATLLKWEQSGAYCQFQWAGWLGQSASQFERLLEERDNGGTGRPDLEVKMKSLRCSGKSRVNPKRLSSTVSRGPGLRQQPHAVQGSQPCWRWHEEGQQHYDWSADRFKIRFLR